MSEKERNELFDKIVIVLQNSTEAMLREKNHVDKRLLILSQTEKFTQLLPKQP